MRSEKFRYTNTHSGVPILVASVKKDTVVQIQRHLLQNILMGNNDASEIVTYADSMRSKILDLPFCRHVSLQIPFIYANNAIYTAAKFRVLFACHKNDLYFIGLGASAEPAKGADIMFAFVGLHLRQSWDYATDYVRS